MALLPRRFTEGADWTPARLRTEFDDLMSRFFRGGGEGGLLERGAFTPATDIVETPEEIQVKTEIPGMNPEDMDISLTGDMLTLKGEKKEEKEKEEENFIQRESYYGSFQRRVPLPEYADRDKVSADYKNGVLTVHVGKTKEARSKSVKVDVE